MANSDEVAVHWNALNQATFYNKRIFYSCMQLFSKINQLSFTLSQVNTGNVSQYLLITSLLPVCEVLHILIMKYGIKNKYYAKNPNLLNWDPAISTWESLPIQIQV